MRKNSSLVAPNSCSQARRKSSTMKRSERARRLNLALVTQLRKEGEIVGTHEREKLRLALKAKEVLRQHQSHHFRITKNCFSSRCAFQQAGSLFFVPVINQNVCGCQQSWKVYTLHGEWHPVLVWIEVGCFFQRRFERSFPLSIPHQPYEGKEMTDLRFQI